MLVIATAGHVDHGKSALLRRLTGMEPDRWEQERRRGLTIDLGFVWTGIDSSQMAFVDVPGHERFLSNMLAGAGTVPYTLFVVAADEGWKPQSAEHLAALDALGVSKAILVVTKSDLTDPQATMAQALTEFEATDIEVVSAVAVSARSGLGLGELREALRALAERAERPDPLADVRFWIDRAFTIKGAGTVVTGTLTGGTIRVGDILRLTRTDQPVTVRGMECLGARVDEASGTARVALNLRGMDRAHVQRGDSLATPDAYRLTDTVDVRLRGAPSDGMPVQLNVHIGAAAVRVTRRPLGSDSARLALESALPIRAGDRLVLCHEHRVVAGAIALDVDPPPLVGRRAAQRRWEELAGYRDGVDAEAELRRRGVVHVDELRRVGIRTTTQPLPGGWLVDADHRTMLRDRLIELVSTRAADRQAQPLSVEEAIRALDLPDPRLLAAVMPEALVVRQGKVVPGQAADLVSPAVREGLEVLRQMLQERGFHAPDGVELDGLGLGRAEIAAAVRAGQLVRLAPNVVILPEAIDHACEVLRTLSSPFRLSEARQALGTARRVAVPLLEHLGRARITRMTPDGMHELIGPQQPTLRAAPHPK